MLNFRFQALDLKRGKRQPSLFTRWFIVDILVFFCPLHIKACINCDFCCPTYDLYLLTDPFHADYYEFTVTIGHYYSYLAWHSTIHFVLIWFTFQSVDHVFCLQKFSTFRWEVLVENILTLILVLSLQISSSSPSLGALTDNGRWISFEATT